MKTDKKIAVPSSSVGADVEQPLLNSKNIISDNSKTGKFKNTVEVAPLNRVPLLETKNLSEILDETYEPQIPLIENFLYRGTYLFVGSPKVGKSISNGTDWISYQHRKTIMGDACESRHSFISCTGR